ncbi:ANTAR domain-containing protein [Streptomyces sp. H27-D2]|uniref:ANTAR domain-containing protein n=1 Tax=Streptomyces sp. H27-D2 TaxID=3046304 RepID=UPI002DB834B3|nr:ANTAR domain-containing protein [Streptomyces sp. H27-D2]MEC4016999.1 ANTAR domain-containing protein [Streptomyces sp. H27-D2]
MLEVDGVAVSVGLGGSELLWFSDEASARLDDLQFTLGEGPSLEAIHDGALCLETDLERASAQRWPVFAPAAVAAGVRAVFAFPLRLGAIHVGGMTAHLHTNGRLGQKMIADALAIADALTVHLLTLRPSPEDPHDSAQPREPSGIAGLEEPQSRLEAEELHDLPGSGDACDPRGTAESDPQGRAEPHGFSDPEGSHGRPRPVGRTGQPGPAPPGASAGSGAPDPSAHDGSGDSGGSAASNGNLFSDLHRAEVHQATGMLSAQLEIPLAHALLRLRGYTFAHDRGIIDVARDVIAGRLEFPQDPAPPTPL